MILKKNQSLKIATILPYKENYTPDKASAASLWVSEFYKNSKFKKNNFIYGHTKSKKYLTKNYININLKNIKSKIRSTTNEYAEKLIKDLNSKNYNIIEVHNRPQLLLKLLNKVKSRFIFYFHNDPLSMNGSKSINDRLRILNSIDKLIFVSEWVRNRFFLNIDKKLQSKTEIVYPSVYKQKTVKKKKNIIFVGKLQWANVVRWEMRTRLFLRTAEFLWQEGHTAHATKAEAIEETIQMNEIYAKFVEDFMGIPVIQGTKTESERFAGAVETYCIEALMQDGKALQAGTAHFLGQNFAKAFDVKFANKEGKLEHVWATSWGVSTRLMGALIMTHSDDKGLVLPPNLAPFQVVIVPIFKGEEQRKLVVDHATKIYDSLQAVGIRVKLDDRYTHTPGYKFNDYELKGVPIRLGIGPKDIEKGSVELARRDDLTKSFISQDKLEIHIKELLKEIQNNLFDKALQHRDQHITSCDSYEDFKKVLDSKGGFIAAHWDGTTETEMKIKQETKATIRCIPLDFDKENGTCIYSGKPSVQRVLFAKAY